MNVGCPFGAEQADDGELDQDIPDSRGRPGRLLELRFRWPGRDAVM